MCWCAPSSHCGVHMGEGCVLAKLRHVLTQAVGEAAL